MMSARHGPVDRGESYVPLSLGPMPFMWQQLKVGDNTRHGYPATPGDRTLVQVALFVMSRKVP